MHEDIVVTGPAVWASKYLIKIKGMLLFKNMQLNVLIFTIIITAVDIEK